MKKNGENSYDDIKNEYTLSVSHFAKLCGTTRDTLRYYYEKKIIVPWIDPNNGYHFYSANQISAFFFIRTMRQAGCSLSEIEKMIHSSSGDKIADIISSRVESLHEELSAIKMKIGSLSLGLWIFDNYETYREGTPFFEKMPRASVLATPVANKKSAHHTADIARELSKHLSKISSDDTLTNFPTGVTISFEDLVNKNYVYNNVVSLSPLPPDNSSTFVLPSTSIVGCYHDHNSDNIELSYRKILAFIRKNHLEPVSDLYVMSLINLYDKERNHTYFKFLFICVE